MAYCQRFPATETCPPRLPSRGARRGARLTQPSSERSTTQHPQPPLPLTRRKGRRAGQHDLPTPVEEATGFSARHALVLFALLLAVALNPIVGLLSGNAQAEVAIHFHTTQLAWFTLAGALVGTFMLPFVVKAAGIYGKKRVIVIVTALGLVGDLIAASATSYDILLVGRGIAGIYGAAAAVAYAAARDVFPRPLVGPASALLAGSVGMVGMGGPFLSGWLIDTWGFRGALWFMVAATAFSLVILLAFLPESPVREARVRMDWLGGILLGGALTAIAYGVGKGSEWGWTSGKFLAYLVGALVALIVFGFTQTRIANPLFPMALLARRQVWTVLLATGLSAGALYSVGVVMQLLALMPKIPSISDGLGWSATHNAVVTAPISVAVILSAVATRSWHAGSTRGFCWAPAESSPRSGTGSRPSGTTQRVTSWPGAWSAESGWAWWSPASRS